MRVHIPASIDEAKAELEGLGRLLTAKQWERAAIVYAFTEDRPRGGQRLNVKNLALSIAEFADLGIASLSSRPSVTTYRKAWQSAIDDGHAQPVKPGDDIELPTVPWKEHFGEATPDVQQRVFRQVLADPVAVRAAVEGNPAMASALAEAAMASPTSLGVIERRLNQAPVEPRYSEPWTPPTPDYRQNLVRAAGYITEIVRAIQTGTWSPTPTEGMLLHSLGLLIRQASPETEPDLDLFADIERHLAESAAR